MTRKEFFDEYSVEKDHETDCDFCGQYHHEKALIIPNKNSSIQDFVKGEFEYGAICEDCFVKGFKRKREC